MDVGRCRSCGRPFTSGEVTGVGILRARPVTVGGPIVEFTCPTCRAVTRLVPHGQGRYAPPGQPPPPPPTEEERRVPWRRGVGPAATAGASSERSTTSSSASGSTHEASAEPAARVHVAPPADAAQDAPDSMEAETLSVEEALTVLGVARDATAETIEQAFHRLALTCHPDKVAHLDPDFAVLAAKKFRRLQAARELLLNE